MKLLLDQRLPRSTARLLREAGVDALHTGDCGLARGNDSEILRFDRKEQRAVVSLDADIDMIIVCHEYCPPLCCLTKNCEEEHIK